jgi:osmoprotectant transport system substrate-binding protein
MSAVVTADEPQISENPPRRNMKRTYVLLAAATGLALTLTACGSSGSSSNSTSAAASSTASASASASSSASTGDQPGVTSSATYPAGTGSITIGSADFSESELLADIYADALTAKGVKVTKKLNIGERAAYIAALKDGSIDYIPEYTGSILYFLNTSATAKSPTDVYSALQTAAGPNLTVLNSAAAQDSDTITVTKDTATKYNLKSIGDLKSVASKLTLGAPAAFSTRADGVPALASVYGVTFGKFTPLQAGGTITVTALKNGTVDAADIFSTDASIAANNFVSLTDDKNMFAAQQIVPLVTKSKVTQTIADASNAVSAKLDTKTLADLVSKVSGGNADSVAKTWLASVGLG